MPRGDDLVPLRMREGVAAARGNGEDLFYGIALLGAVALSRWEVTAKRLGAVKRATTFRRRKAESAEPPAAS